MASPIDGRSKSLVHSGNRAFCQLALITEPVTPIQDWSRHELLEELIATKKAHIETQKQAEGFLEQLKKLAASRVGEGSQSRANASVKRMQGSAEPEYRKVVEDRDQYKEKCIGYRKRAHEAESLLDPKTTEHGDAVTKLNGLIAQRDELLAKDQRSGKAIKDKDAELSRLSDKLAHVQDKFDAKFAVCDKAMEANRDCRDLFAQWESGIDAKTESLAQAEADPDSMTRERDESKAALDQANINLTEVTKARDGFETALDTTSGSLKRITKERDESMAALDQANINLTEVTKDRDEFKVALGTASDSLKRVTKERDQFKAAFDQLKINLSDVTKECDDTRAALDTASDSPEMVSPASVPTPNEDLDMEDSPELELEEFTANLDREPWAVSNDGVDRVLFRDLDEAVRRNIEAKLDAEYGMKDKKRPAETYKKRQRGFNASIRPVGLQKMVNERICYNMRIYWPSKERDAPETEACRHCLKMHRLCARWELYEDNRNTFRLCIMPHKGVGGEFKGTPNEQSRWIGK